MKPTKPAVPQRRATDQRRRAEDSLQAQAQSAAVQPSVLQIQKLLHELEVHQIELQMQNEELRESQAETETALARYTDLYDFAPAGYFTLQPDGAITQLNLAGARLLGRERELLTGKQFSAFVSGADLPLFNRMLEQVFLAKIDPNCEVDLLSAGPPQRSVRSVRIEATRSPDGRDCRFVVLDITERKQAEELLRQSAARTSRIVRAAALGLWEWNLLTDEVYFSPEWKGQLGYADDEFANRFDEWQKRVHPEDGPRVQAAVDDFRAGRTPRYAVELRLRHRDGVAALDRRQRRQCRVRFRASNQGASILARGVEVDRGHIQVRDAHCCAQGQDY